MLSPIVKWLFNKGLPEVEKEPQPEKNNWETGPYPTPDPTIDLSFLS